MRMAGTVLAGLLIVAPAFAQELYGPPLPEHDPYLDGLQHGSGDPSGVPLHGLPPLGFCKIWYDGLPSWRQPPAMDCDDAVTQASEWGGRVVESLDWDDKVGRTRVNFGYRGNAIAAIPLEAIPSMGTCRAWAKDVSDDAQTSEGPCEEVRRSAPAGSVIAYMPG